MWDDEEEDFWEMASEINDLLIDLDSEREDYCRAEEDGWFYTE